MKKYILALACLVSSGAFASEVTLNCHRTSDGDLVQETDLRVTLSESQIRFELIFYREKKEVVSAFSRIVANGNRMYEGSALTELADQTDRGNIFVSPGLLNGRSGTMSFSVRQLGDSEGSSWLGETFRCTQ